MFKSVNPASGTEIATYEELKPDEIEAKLAAAASAFVSWRNTSLDERVAMLRAIADRFEADKERLAEVATEEMGKTYKSSLAEVEKCIAGFRYYAEHGPAMLEPRRVKLGNGGTAETRYLPLGPVLAVMPWNFPYWQGGRFLAPTILGGNV